MKAPIYQRFHFEDGEDHGLPRRDVLRREQEQLLALAKATGDYAPLHRWLDTRAQEGFGLVAAHQEKHEQAQAVKARAEKARAAKDEQTRLKYARIRDIAEMSPDLDRDDLMAFIVTTWAYRYGEKTVPKQRTIDRALGRLP